MSLLHRRSIYYPWNRKSVISTRNDTNGRSSAKNAFIRFSLFRVCRVELDGLDMDYRRRKCEAKRLKKDYFIILLR